MPALHMPPGVTDGINPHIAAARARLVRGTSTGLADELRFIVLCFVNRCGSNFVAQALASSGFLNSGGEWLNAGAITANTAPADTMTDYMNFLARRFGRNGIFVFKAAITQLDMLNEFEVLGPMLRRTHFIVIQRA